MVTVRANVANQGADDTTFDLVLTDLTAGLVLDAVPVSLAVFETQTVDGTSRASDGVDCSPICKTNS